MYDVTSLALKLSNDEGNLVDGWSTHLKHRTSTRLGNLPPVSDSYRMSFLPFLAMKWDRVLFDTIPSSKLT